MKIAGYNIKFVGESNFPMLPPLVPPQGVAYNTRSRSRSITDFYGRSNVGVAFDYIKKIVGIEATTSELVTKTRNIVQVNIGTAEVWAGRLGVAVSCLSLAKQYF